MITRENRVLRGPSRRFLLLPVPGGALESYELKGPHAWPRPEGRPASRVAYAAAYEEQIGTVEDTGARVILIASRQLAARTPRRSTA